MGVPLSSGLALSGSLQDILTRQKVEARQQMLDEMARQEQESRQQYQAESLKSLQEQRKVLNEQRILGMLDSGVYGAGENVDGMDPEVLEVGKRYGRIQHLPGETTTTQTPFMAPNPQGETEGTLDQNMAESVTVRPDRNVYRGSPAELKNRRRQQEVGKAMEAISDPNMGYLEKMTILANAWGMDTLPSGVFTALQPEQEMGIVDEATGKISAAINPATGKPFRTSGNPLTVRNRPPQGPQPQFVGLTPDGKEGVFAVGGTFRTAPLPQGGIAPKPTTARPAGYVPVLDNASSQKLADARAKLGAGWWTSDTARRQFASLAQNDIANAKVSPSVKTAVWDIINNPAYKGRSAEDIIGEYKNASGITPQELNELGSLLMQVIETP